MLRFRSLALRLSGLLLAAAAVAGCAGSATPALIGSYPKVIATAAPPRNVFVVYTSDLELSVNSVDTAAIEAGEIAARFGGYLTEANIWSYSNPPQATVTLAIPVAYYQDARKAVSSLGTLTSERLSGDLTIAYGDAARWTTFTHLTLRLTQAKVIAAPRSWPSFGWSPAQTLAQAFGVSAMLFTIVLDIVIWVVVVLGPFVLLGLVIRWVLRQVRK
jgi:hypothetical protein